MATKISKKINGYGPYLYHVEWIDGEQKWTYLGRTDSIDDPRSAAAEHPDIESDVSSQRKEINPVEKPAERMEQLLDKKGIDAEVIKREIEGNSNREGYIIDFSDEDELIQYFEAVDDGEFIYPSQQQKLDYLRDESDDFETTIVMPRAALIDSVIDKDGYDDDPSGGDDVVFVEGLNHYSDGKFYVDIEYEHKDKLKSIDDSGATWNGGSWEIDMDSLDVIEEELENEGLEVRLSSEAKAYRDAKDS